MRITKVHNLIFITIAIAILSVLLTNNIGQMFVSPVAATNVESSSNYDCQKSQDLPWLQIDGKWVKDEAGNPVTLRGMSFCGFNNDWGEKALPDFQQKIAKVTNGTNGWYPNLLRLPIKDYHLDNFSLEQVYQTLQAGVDECVKQKVYCIIDWHAVDGEESADWRSPEMEHKTIAFWNYIAPRFKDYSNVIFELYNEPGRPKLVSKYNWKIWRDTAQEWVDIIREKAPKNIILIGSPLWAQIIRYAPDYPFEGENLAYVNHTYQGMEESWPRELGLEYDWEEVFGKAADRVSIFMTEFGWQADAEWEFSTATTAEFGRPMKEFLSKRPNINWTVWTYDHYCSPRLADENDRVLGGNKMGLFMRQWLKEEWAKPTNPVRSCQANFIN